MHTSTVSQQPILLMPAEIGKRLQLSNLRPAPLNALGDAAIHQFSRTADVVARPPWNMIKAHAYLHELCSNNVDPKVPDVDGTCFNVLTNIRLKPLQRHTVDMHVREHVGGPVRQVQVAQLSESQKRK
eukprot:4257984-Karenia_brevis.AAC.1